MVTPEIFAEIALAFPGTEENPHFERRAFKVTGRRIFATLLEKDRTANLRLTLEEQQVFSAFGKSVYPVPNKWGEQGWTTFELEHLPVELLQEALDSAYRYAASKS